MLFLAMSKTQNDVVRHNLLHRANRVIRLAKGRNDERLLDFGYKMKDAVERKYDRALTLTEEEDKLLNMTRAEIQWIIRGAERPKVLVDLQARRAVLEAQPVRANADYYVYGVFVGGDQPKDCVYVGKGCRSRIAAYRPDRVLGKIQRRRVVRFVYRLLEHLIREKIEYTTVKIVQYLSKEDVTKAEYTVIKDYLAAGARLTNVQGRVKHVEWYPHLFNVDMDTLRGKLRDLLTCYSSQTIIETLAQVTQTNASVDVEMDDDETDDE
jgi:hypothetical protein